MGQSQEDRQSFTFTAHQGSLSATNSDVALQNQFRTQGGVRAMQIQAAVVLQATLVHNLLL